MAKFVGFSKNAIEMRTLLRLLLIITLRPLCVGSEGIVLLSIALFSGQRILLEG